MLWDLEKNQPSVRIQVQQNLTTKRGLLRVLSSVYDPLVLSPQILIDLAGEVVKTDSLSSSQCYKREDMVDVILYQLYHLSDASQKAYEAVSYLYMIGAELGKPVFSNVWQSKASFFETAHYTASRAQLLRSLSAAEISADCRWTQGPSFLWKGEHEWPSQSEDGHDWHHDPEIFSLMDNHSTEPCMRMPS
ncbi:hypothetical protein O3P69_004709 [Scylla paramamosain]|uniref:Uncharacterized protein n=1 Tax=Scylla paramamosain TaxID=85552 RepID=A0AAW0UEQ6_SCYPA